MELTRSHVPPSCLTDGRVCTSDVRYHSAFIFVLTVELTANKFQVFLFFFRVMSTPSNNPIKKTGLSGIPRGPAVATRSQTKSNTSSSSSSASGQSERSPGDNRVTTPTEARRASPPPPSQAACVRQQRGPAGPPPPAPTPPPPTDSSSESDSESDLSGSDLSESDTDLDSDDMAVAPEKFSGHGDPREWLDDLAAYTSVKKLDDRQGASLARFLFKDDGLRWYRTLPPAIKASFETLRLAFEAYWVTGPKKPDRGLQLRRLTSTSQKPGQSVPDYVNELVSLSKELPLDDAILVSIIESGLRPDLLPFFRQARPATPQDVIACEALQVAACTSMASTAVDTDLIQAIDDLLTAKLQAFGVVAQASATVPMQATSPQPRPPPRSLQRRGPDQQQQQQQQQQRHQQQQQMQSLCSHCGQPHCKGGKGCFAYNAVCNHCGIKNHWYSVCRKRLDTLARQQQQHQSNTNRHAYSNQFQTHGQRPFSSRPHPPNYQHSA